MRKVALFSLFNAGGRSRHGACTLTGAHPPRRLLSRSAPKRPPRGNITVDYIRFRPGGRILRHAVDQDRASAFADSLK
jgi:hypothetical protein